MKTLDTVRPGALFVGYFTIFGPHGQITGTSETAVENFADELLLKWPHALRSDVREVRQHVWRATIWSKLELAGNE